MTNIPLIQGNSIQEINTSIIAIKKAQNELETLNTQIDNKIKALNLALSGGPGKYIESIQEVQGLIKVTEGSITDTIASGNSQPATSNGVASAISENAPLCYSSATRTITGETLKAGVIIRILFTTQQTGSNTSTAFTITYNETTYTVKAPKNGSLSNFVASNINGTYVYCQAYTTLELLFDDTQFVIIGNPVVISSADYTIYTDGSRVYKDVTRPIYKEGIAIPTNTEQKVHDLLGQGCYLICAYMENAQFGSYAFYSKTNYNEYVTTIRNYLVDISIKSDGIYIKNRTPYSFTTYFRIVKLL